MAGWFAPFDALPPYALAGIVVMILYAVQSEVRFGARARRHRSGAADRNSTIAVSLSAAVPIVGFVCAIKRWPWLPQWFRRATLPGMPLVAWIGVAFGVLGLSLRLWAVLTLRERYTRTLLIQREHPLERSGPYRWVRHPGYLGSLLCLNGVALASGNAATLAISLVATSLAYAYRIKVEDEMLVSALGEPYSEYRRDVHALIPSVPRLDVKRS